MKKSIAEYMLGMLVLFVCLWTVLFSVLHILYPVKYGDFVTKYSEEYNIDSSLVFSVMKNESGFRSDAVSAENAVGLMQITPDTGDWIAEKMNIKAYSLSNPETNIMFSCWYLDYLTGRFGDIRTALAAYNAGMGNVTSWLKDSKYSDDGKTLNKIPYGETEKYIQRIRTLRKVYKILY